MRLFSLALLAPVLVAGCALSASNPPLPRSGLTLQGGRETLEDVETLLPFIIGVQQDAGGNWIADFGEGLELVYVPPGLFAMGVDGGPSDAGPAREVWLDGYWISRLPVTQAMFRQFLTWSAYEPQAFRAGALGHNRTEWFFRPEINSRSPGFGHTEDQPVICVTYADAEFFLRWLSNRHGLTFALPLEAQWEKAARGTDGRTWPWGDEAPDGTRANFADARFLSTHGESPRADRASPDVDDFWRHTSPVDAYPAGASPYGVLDLAGNAAEWCRDVYDAELYTRGMERNPGVMPMVEATPDTLRVVRGGGWSDSAAGPEPSIRSWERSSEPQGTARDDLGFRIVLRYDPFPPEPLGAGEQGPTLH